MPSPCDTVTSGLYAARHNPAVYYTSPSRRLCALDDVPMGPIGSRALHRALYGGTLANFVFVTPNICDDAHSCPVRLGDAWLSRFLSVVFASPTYRLGHTVGVRHLGRGQPRQPGRDHRRRPVRCRAGHAPRVAFDHYSLLRTAEQLLGLPPLANAAKASSMVAAFHL